ncbi:ribonuclease Z [Clostridium tepidiprofundi DSM 19306]|uniref:Ribonuclease Z n=2 Tax=Clostridium TaxID=1485 RepID=A0A151B2Q0_9CLOT|nr:ribonuclease Z [Clostridium tepidiprofundi DSM 19306]
MNVTTIIINAKYISIFCTPGVILFMLRLSLLGTGGMVPMPNRFLTSLLLSCGGKMILIDCGEGTQISLKSLGWGIKNIDIICITHFHADHTAGLPGLLSTIGNSGRTETLTIIGPPGVKSVVECLTVIAPITYPLEFVEIPIEGLRNYTHGDFTINTIWLEHHIPCASYSIEIKRSRKFNREKAENNNIPIKFWNKLRNGEIIEYNNKTFTPDMVLGETRKGIKICYSTDTRPVPEMIPFIENADLFVCEGMYGDDNDFEKAYSKKHMLFSEAANLAKEGNVKELWLTHFSPALVNPSEYIDFAKNIFDNVIVGTDRMVKELSFK